MRVRLLGFIAAILLSSTALAVPITVTYTGTGSGTIGGTSFGSSAFTITAIGDSAWIYHVPGISGVYHSSATIDISGLGSFNFLVGLRTFVNRNVGVAGLSRVTGGDLYNSTYNPAFDTWDVESSLGPIEDDFRLLQWNPIPGSQWLLPVLTSGGDLVFNNSVGAGTFQSTYGAAPVSEPSTIALFVIALFGLLVASRRFARNR